MAFATKSAPVLRLVDLPIETVEEIARNLDSESESWFALRFTCRTLRIKSLHPFGQRFFSTLKFCLHPVSLQALTDISYTYDLAIHVRHVAFGLEDFGLIDPIHDDDVKQASRYPYIVLPHSDCFARPIAPGELSQVRARVNAQIISQALARFPKLKLLMVGGALELGGHELGASWGISQARPFICPSGHCSANTRDIWLPLVFNTVMLAFQQLHSSDVRICIRVEVHDQLRLSQVYTSFGLWFPFEEGRQHLNHLQLCTLMIDGSGARGVLSDLYKGSKIDTLLVQCSTPSDRPQNHVGLAGIPLDHLRSITFNDGWLSPSTLARFFHIHRYKLEQLSLVRCSVNSKPVSLHLIPWDTWGSWWNVIHVLQAMPSLSFVHLDHINIGPVAGQNSHLNSILNRDMSLCGTWTCREEVKMGLNYLGLTHEAIVHPALETRSPRSILRNVAMLPTHQIHNANQDYLLNLRWANFKASPRYAWTQDEIQYLRHFRRTHQSSHITCDPRHFPVQGEPGLSGLRGVLPNTSPTDQSEEVLPPGCVLIDSDNPAWSAVWIQDSNSMPTQKIFDPESICSSGTITG